MLTERDLKRMRSAPLDDVELLFDEVERVSERLAECWLLLDDLARAGDCGTGYLETLAERAGELLRKQDVPGWKT